MNSCVNVELRSNVSKISLVSNIRVDMMNDQRLKLSKAWTPSTILLWNCSAHRSGKSKEYEHRKEHAEKKTQ
jgi:hypothetical protein